MSTYQEAHKELINKNLLTVYGRASNTGVQTSNMNRIARADNFTIIRPDSWNLPEEPDIDTWCDLHLQPEPSVEPKPELSV